MKKLSFYVLALIIFNSCVNKQNFNLQNGDLLFSVGKGDSELLTAIQNSTSKDKDIPISHVGIVSIEDGNTYVIEATSPDGVVKTPLDAFFDDAATLEGKPLIQVGRLKKEFAYLLPQATTNAAEHLGKEYDYAYDEENDALYCSELVRVAYVDSLGKPLFEPLAMSFKDKATNKIDPYWEEHFARMNREVPEGKPGTNPADMAKSPLIKIVHRYY